MKLTKKQLEAKREHHNKRYQFYDKKIEELSKPNQIGFKLKRS